MRINEPYNTHVPNLRLHFKDIYLIAFALACKEKRWVGPTLKLGFKARVFNTWPYMCGWGLHNWIAH